MAGEEDITEKLDAMNTPVGRLLPGHERSSIIYTLYNKAFHAAYRKAQAFDGVKDLQLFFTWLAKHCLLSGIPEEEAIRWTRTHSRFHGCETHMRSCFHTVYIQQESFGKKPSISPTMTLMATLDEFMQRRYRFRRNVMKGTVEYQEIRSFYFDFRPVDKTAMNSICMNAHSEGLEVWDADIRRYVGSNRIPVYNPVEEFLYNLPVWNGKDYIGEMALRVPCNHPRWNEFFRIWFLSMVAHWLGMDKEHANSTLPLLVGDQGCGKSTFCMNLLPHHLRGVLHG
ncbi:MAG: virulence-associated E family protein [Bacteroides sp.]|nr:virulence-associated E family protein [Bacteroides sp.]